MVDGQKTLIDCCIEAGVPRYVASDWCLDYRDLVRCLPPATATHVPKPCPDAELT